MLKACDQQARKNGVEAVDAFFAGKSSADALRYMEAASYPFRNAKGLVGEVTARGPFLGRAQAALSDVDEVVITFRARGDLKSLLRVSQPDVVVLGTNEQGALYLRGWCSAKNVAPEVFRTPSFLRSAQAEMQKALTQHTQAGYRAFAASEKDLQWIDDVLGNPLLVSQKTYKAVVNFDDFLTANGIDRIPLTTLDAANSFFF